MLLGLLVDKTIIVSLLPNRCRQALPAWQPVRKTSAGRINSLVSPLVLDELSRWKTHARLMCCAYDLALLLLRDVALARLKAC